MTSERRRKGHRAMVKNILIGLITWSLLAVLLAACTIEDTSAQTNPTVHMVHQTSFAL
jgi:hypothetical protein